MQIGMPERREERWEAWNQLCSQIVVKNFTQKGFEVVDLPKEVFQRVKQHYDENYAHKTPEQIPLEMDGATPDFVNNPPELNDFVLSSLQDIHQKWAGVPLLPSIAYGTRVYKRDNVLAMHIDVIEVSGLPRAAPTDPIHIRTNQPPDPHH